MIASRSEKWDKEDFFGSDFVVGKKSKNFLRRFTRNMLLIGI